MDERGERHGRSLVERILWNADERRPRAGWRLLCGGVSMVLAAVGVGLLFFLFPAPETVTGRYLRPAYRTAVRFGSQLALVGGLLVAALVVDRRRLADFGLGLDRAWLADLGFGLALGLGLPAGIFALELAAGFVTVTGLVQTRASPTFGFDAGGAVPLAFALTLFGFVAVSVFEEVLFRGYLLTNVAEGLSGLWGTSARTAIIVATAVTSALFGLVHASNPNVTGLAVINIVAYGVLLAAGFLVTGRLGISLGFHFTWNLAVSSVFGFPVSGARTPATVVAIEQSGPQLLTGGAFGPEGGLLALVALVAGFGLLGAWQRLQGRPLGLQGSIAVPTLRTASADDRD
jgi:membrane protease YdiL (CAAX protease family)